MSKYQNNKKEYRFVSIDCKPEFYNQVKEKIMFLKNDLTVGEFFCKIAKETKDVSNELVFELKAKYRQEFLNTKGARVKYLAWIKHIHYSNYQKDLGLKSHKFILLYIYYRYKIEKINIGAS